MNHANKYIDNWLKFFLAMEFPVNEGPTCHAALYHLVARL